MFYVLPKFNELWLQTANNDAGRQSLLLAAVESTAARTKQKMKFEPSHWQNYKCWGSETYAVRQTDNT